MPEFRCSSHLDGPISGECSNLSLRESHGANLFPYSRKMKLDNGWSFILEASWEGHLNLCYLLVGKVVLRQRGGEPKCWYENELQQVRWAVGRARKSNTAHGAPLPPVLRHSSALSFIRNHQKIRSLSHPDILTALASRTHLVV